MHSQTATRLTISLPTATKRALEGAIPARQRSRFIAEAVDRALAEEARKDTVSAMLSLPTVKARTSAAAAVRAVREQAELATTNRRK